MLRQLLIGILIGLLASAGGCAAPGFVVRSDRGRAPVELQRVRPVEYAKEDLQHAVEPYAEHLAAVIRQRDGQLRLSLASASGAPADPRQLAALVEPYLGWCAQRGAPGDCLEVLDARTPGLSTDAKHTIALRMALASGLQEAAQVVRDINPVKLEATLVIWFTIYLATLVFPDATVTKALFVIMTANLIAFLGVDGFRNIIQGYRDMATEVDAAETFDKLRGAGERYGRRMGPSMLRIVTALVTWGVSAATGMARPVTSLPGGAQAVANAQAQGFHLAAVSGVSVSVSASGTVTLVVASQATVPEQGGAANASTQDPVGKPQPPIITNGVTLSEKRASHIFREKAGHLSDTPANRRLLQEVAEDPKARLGTDQFGNTWSARTNPDGSQTWVQSRNGEIINGGVNQRPRAFNPQTGLSGSQATMSPK